MGNKFQLGAKYPPINWEKLNGIFNRTLGFRNDADAIVRHGYYEKLNSVLLLLLLMMLAPGW